MKNPLNVDVTSGGQLSSLAEQTPYTINVPMMNIAINISTVRIIKSVFAIFLELSPLCFGDDLISTDTSDEVLFSVLVRSIVVDIVCVKVSIFLTEKIMPEQELLMMPRMQLSQLLLMRLLSQYNYLGM
jgi:hypothetical protein